MELDIAVLGASHVNKDGVPVVQASIGVKNETDDVEPFGDIDFLQTLGVSSLPWGAGPDGHAEGLVARGVGGRDGICIGARDTRTAGIVGKLKPGDTVVHTTGPQQAAQLQLKEEKRQAALVSEDTTGKTMMFMLDGKGDKIQLTAFGSIIEISRDGISIVSAGDIVLSGKTVSIQGQVILGGATPNPAMRVMTAPTASPGGAGALPMVPAPGIFIGV